MKDVRIPVCINSCYVGRLVVALFNHVSKKITLMKEISIINSTRKHLYCIQHICKLLTANAKHSYWTYSSQIVLTPSVFYQSHNLSIIIIKCFSSLNLTRHIGYEPQYHLFVDPLIQQPPLYDFCAHSPSKLTQQNSFVTEYLLFSWSLGNKVKVPVEFSFKETSSIHIYCFPPDLIVCILEVPQTCWMHFFPPRIFAKLIILFLIHFKLLVVYILESWLAVFFIVFVGMLRISLFTTTTSC